MTDASPLAPPTADLEQIWAEHMKHEFFTRSAEETLATMVPDAYVNHVPVLTGGRGHEELRAFYSKRFIPQIPPDIEMTPLSRTVGRDRLVDELLATFTHSLVMDWILPGVAPTGRRIELPFVVIIDFRDGKVAREQLYWDQASVLVQIGLLDPTGLPIAGVEVARKAQFPDSVPFR